MKIVSKICIAAVLVLSSVTSMAADELYEKASMEGSFRMVAAHCGGKKFGARYLAASKKDVSFSYSQEDAKRFEDIARASPKFSAAEIIAEYDKKNCKEFMPKLTEMVEVREKNFKTLENGMARLLGGAAK